MGVFEKHLVEVAHAEKQYRVPVAGLDLAILLHQWSAGGIRHAFCHCSFTRNGEPPTAPRTFGMAACALSRSG
jgi:hypothetical protein